MPVSSRGFSGQLLAGLGEQASDPLLFSQKHMNIESFAIYLAPLALIVFFYLRGRYKHETAAVELLTENIEAGLTEPPSLHPEINPTLCMGAGSCITACPENAIGMIKGKAVLINFWATWCAPCKIETPWLIELRNQYAAQGFEVLGISADDIDRGDPQKLSDEKKQIARFVQQTQMPYPVLIDADSISQPYGGLDSLPTSFFVDRNGIVVAAQLGLTSKGEIEANIRKALGD